MNNYISGNAFIDANNIFMRKNVAIMAQHQFVDGIYCGNDKYILLTKLGEIYTLNGDITTKCSPEYVWNKNLYAQISNNNITRVAQNDYSHIVGFSIGSNHFIYLKNGKTGEREIVKKYDVLCADERHGAIVARNSDVDIYENGVAIDRLSGNIFPEKYQYALDDYNNAYNYIISIRGELQRFSGTLNVEIMANDIVKSNKFASMMLANGALYYVRKGDNLRKYALFDNPICINFYGKYVMFGKYIYAHDRKTQEVYGPYDTLAKIMVCNNAIIIAVDNKGNIHKIVR